MKNTKAPQTQDHGPEDEGGVELIKNPLQVWRWRIRNHRGEVILSSPRGYFHKEEAKEELSAITTYLVDYQAQEKKKTPYKRK